jgi:enolase-phosphatase E1
MIKAILTDIEGTTTSLSFVKDVLFPYADQQMQAFVVAHRQDPVVAALIDDVRLETGNAVLSLAEAIAQLRQWIAEDKKITPLKALQGRNGDFTGHVYEDAVRHLLHWHELGLKLYVYSSGSVYAQKLLFGYSDAGDLTSLFSGYFDTAVGHKREAKSYHTIVAVLGLPASEILFLSDIAEELDAAAQAGLQTCCLVREDQPTDTLQHRWVKNFDELDVMAIT